MDWGTEYFGSGTGSKGDRIDSVALLNPEWKSRTKSFSGLFGYAKKLSETDQKKAQKVRENLETYLNELTKAYDTVKDYDKEKQKTSKLWGEITLGFLACERWMQNVQINKVPRDIELSLVRKTGRLQSYIHLESLAALSDVSKEYDNLIAQAKVSGDVKHPLVYYDKGRELMFKNKWYDAKQEFIKYERLMVGKDDRCRNPCDDNCYYYLSYCQEQINAQNITADNNPILSKNPYASVIGTPKNEYQKLYEQWKVKYPPSKKAYDSISPLKKDKVKSPVTSPPEQKKK